MIKIDRKGIIAIDVLIMHQQLQNLLYHTNPARVGRNKGTKVPSNYSSGEVSCRNASSFYLLDRLAELGSTGVAWQPLLLGTFTFTNHRDTQTPGARGVNGKLANYRRQVLSVLYKDEG